nr:MAG TPA_asm: hypothetical protein [Bacteriophage sp.]
MLKPLIYIFLNFSLFKLYPFVLKTNFKAFRGRLEFKIFLNLYKSINHT